MSLTPELWALFGMMAAVIISLLGGLYAILMSYLTIREHSEAMKRIDDRLNDLRTMIMLRVVKEPDK